MFNLGINLFTDFQLTGKGKHILLECSDGSWKYDFSGLLGTHIMGYSFFNAESSDHNFVSSGPSFPSQLAINLQEKISTLAPDFFFYPTGTSGSLANEFALKLLKNNFNNKFLIFDGCYAGKTLLLQDLAKAENQFLNTELLSFNESLTNLKKIFSKNQGSILYIELAQGNNGYRHRKDWKDVIELAKKFNIGIWIDEIQTFLRTPKIFLSKHFDVFQYADIITVGKSLQINGVFIKKNLNIDYAVGGTSFGSQEQMFYATKLLLEINKTNNYKILIDEIPNIFKDFNINQCQGLVAIECNNPKELTKKLAHQNFIVYYSGNNHIRLLPHWNTTIDEMKQFRDTLQNLS